MQDLTIKRLQAAPERAVLFVLEAAIEGAQKMLRSQHPTVFDPIDDPRVEPPASLVAAHLLVDRLYELQEILGYYESSVQRATESFQCQCDRDLPF